MDTVKRISAKALFDYCVAQRPDWTVEEAAEVAAYWPHVAPSHGGKFNVTFDRMKERLLESLIPELNSRQTF
jgi:hypothetical protein